MTIKTLIQKYRQANSWISDHSKVVPLDKIIHFVIGFLIPVIIMKLRPSFVGEFTALLISIVISLIVFVSKDLTDLNPDVADIIAGLTGTSISVMMYLMLYHS